jgi:hypothetical protein
MFRTKNNQRLVFWCHLLKSKTPLPPKAEAAEAISLSGSMHEQCDQDNDRDWHAKKEQK